MDSSKEFLRRSNGSEPFLSGRIPDLKFHFLAVDFYGSYLEIDANCCDITSRESVVRKSQEKTAFSDPLNKSMINWMKNKFRPVFRY